MAINACSVPRLLFLNHFFNSFSSWNIGIADSVVNILDEILEEKLEDLGEADETAVTKGITNYSTVNNSMPTLYNFWMIFTNITTHFQ
jgi:hypothetical protein